jgi:glycosyltransferase involved in cell wall biosynthesis
MSPSSNTNKRSFVVATPGRSVCDDNARALERHGLLRCYALGTRRGTSGIPMERTRLKPALGLAAYAAAKTFSAYAAESFRFRLHPWFDHWVRKQLIPGDHIISSYGYANDSFRWVRQNGGRTFLDGGNSHPENFWTILSEEHRRWHCSYPPVARHHYERSVAMMEQVDFVLSPSSFVSRSFLERGFKPQQILKNIYPVDLSCFSPAKLPRDKNRPLTIISTGGLSLRKGAPYMLEAFRLIHKRHPSARFRLTRTIQDSAIPIVARYQDLPIDWAPSLPHAQLAERLQSSDIFVLPSLEEGLVRTALEAMACGLPAILTPNTGSADFVQPGVNGEVVPIRDPQAIADALLKWADVVMNQSGPPIRLFDPAVLSYDHFEKQFIDQLAGLNLGHGL